MLKPQKEEKNTFNSVPLAVETYCNWGEEAGRGIFATRLALDSSSHKARMIMTCLLN